MDISVAHLNNRLALQLPTQLPLGLVFVQGQVANLTYDTAPKVVKGTRFPASLDLLGGGHLIRCRLSERVLKETPLSDGDLIRAGGHLIFNTQRADYELLARDVEVVVDNEVAEVAAAPSPLEAQIGRPALSPLLADIKRRAEAAKLAPGEMPGWVQRLAPPDLQSELNAQAEPTAKGAGEPEEIDADLMHFLAMAMEKPEDVEITPDLLEKVGGGATAVSLTPGRQIPKTPATTTRKPLPATSRQPLDWSLILLLISVVVLAVALLLIFLILSG